MMPAKDCYACPCLNVRVVTDENSGDDVNESMPDLSGVFLEQDRVVGIGKEVQINIVSASFKEEVLPSSLLICTCFSDYHQVSTPSPSLFIFLITSSPLLHLYVALIIRVDGTG